MKASVVVICAAAIGLAGCTGGSKNHASSTTTSQVTTTTTTDATTTTAEVAPTTKRLAAYLIKVDATKGELTYDEIQFLTGDAAKAAYKKDNPCKNPSGCEDAPPNDYYIVNQYKAYKTVAIAPNCEVELNVLAPNNPGSESQGASVKELADAFVPGKTTPDGRDRSQYASTRPFWLTIRTDADASAVTKIEEQFTP